MALKYGFYNSVNGDRTYDAEDFSRFFDGVLTDGVLPTVGQAFDTTHSGTNVVVGSGRAWFNKTWTYNDAAMSMELPSASNVNNRIDLLVLEVDTRTSTRENRLVFVVGTPSVNPTRPSLSPATGVYQYPLYEIYRRRDVQEIRAQDLTRLVGTGMCPYAGMALTTVNEWNNLAHKRSVVRGQNLGSTFTPAQRLAVRDGSFEGLYLNDYWVRGGVTWRIVDFNYFMKMAKGVNGQLSTTATSSDITDNHLVVVPDDTRPIVTPTRPFVDTNPKKASNCGFDFSTVARTHLNTIASNLGGLVGTQNLVATRAFLPSAYSAANHSMARQVRFSRAVPLTELMITGNRAMGLRYSTIHTDAFALYKHGHRYVWQGFDGDGSHPGTFWVAEQYNVSHWLIYQGWLGFTASNPRATGSSGYAQRPALIVTGKS